jgi:hypothetical protein
MRTSISGHRWQIVFHSRSVSGLGGTCALARSCVVVLTGTIIPEVNIKQMPDNVMVLDRDRPSCPRF